MTSDEGTRPESETEADHSVPLDAHHHDDDDSTLGPSNALDRAARDELSVFEGLQIPDPIPAAPPTGARILAFAGILLGGLLGGLIGYGVFDLYFGSSTWAAFGALLFGVGAAVGLGIVTSLTLRAMNEWREVQHPEARNTISSLGDARAQTSTSDADPKD